MNATENVKKCFALYCKLDDREVEYLNAMICAKGMLSGVVAEPEERKGPGRPRGSKSKPKVDLPHQKLLRCTFCNEPEGHDGMIVHAARCVHSKQMGVDFSVMDNGKLLASGEEK